MFTCICSSYEDFCFGSHVECHLGVNSNSKSCSFDDIKSQYHGSAGRATRIFMEERCRVFMRALENQPIHDISFECQL